MKCAFSHIKNVLLAFAAAALISGCVNGPLYPWARCSPNAPYRIGCYYPSSCTEYHPNSYYRCTNQRCTTYSPYAPNKCDPYPYYTGCKYTACCQGVYSSYF